MNAHTTKAANAFLPPETHASRTGLMLSLARAFEALSAWNRRRRTMTELNSLTERELRDIGLTRADIGFHARDGR